MGIQTIQPKIKKYLWNVRKQIKVQKALLFGSYAEGKAIKTSDVDLIILSDDFRKYDIDQRSRLLYRASVGFPYDLHVYGFTLQEYLHASPFSALSMIKKTTTIPVS